MARSQSVRRRGNPSQGHALESLGHAIEYLLDSRLFMRDEAAARCGDDAVRLLMRCSREVFSECPEVISLKRRLRLWLVDRLAPAPAASDPRQDALQSANGARW